MANNEEDEVAPDRSRPPQELISRQQLDPKILSDAIDQITVNSDDGDLEKLMDLLMDQKVASLKNIHINILPNSGTHEVQIEWLGYDQWGRLDYHIPELCNLPDGTVKTLNMDNQLFLIIPIAAIFNEHSFTPFEIIRVLCWQEYWVIFDRKWDNTEDSRVDVVPIEERHACFPGTKVDITVGLLSGLFDGNVTLSETRQASYSVGNAMRVNGTIQPRR